MHPLQVFQQLGAMHGARHWHWDARTDPFEVAVGAILVQNTAWSNAERAIENLRRAGALEPYALASLTDDELEALIRSSGQFRQKARRLRAFLHLVDETGGFEAVLTLPPDELRSRLLATWGIGPETADVIVLYCARAPAFVVDAYTKRIFARLGLGPGEDASYRSWQAWLSAHLPPVVEDWARYHALLVLHGKHLCLKRAPRCGACALATVCRCAQPARHEAVT